MCIRDRADTVSFLSSFSVGLIPFTRDALTLGVDPIKYYQYRGAGLPVLSTSFGDMVERTEADDTFFLDPDGDLAAPIQAALSRRPDAAAVAAFRVGNTWAARFTDARILSPQ